MRIPVNPNATEAITAVCANLARTAACPGTEVIGWTNRQGWPAIDRAARAAAEQSQQARAAAPGVR